jgi:RNA polymerase sigma factor (TIGR02999 family)
VAFGSTLSCGWQRRLPILLDSEHARRAFLATIAVGRVDVLEQPELDRAGEITRLAARWSAGDRDAFQSLIELVYDELRELAHRSIGNSRPDAVLDTTVLVHEAYLRLARVEGSAWPSRAHFFSFCARAMRRIVIDYARRQAAGKRGGGQLRVPLTAGTAAARSEDLAEVLAVEDALTRLEQRNGRMARIVECRFYGGMSTAETAEALATSTRTVEREWARARAYLQQALAGDA